MSSHIPPDGLSAAEVTPRIADLLHIGAVHRRRVQEGRSSEVDRQALTHQLRQVQQVWPPQSPQRGQLQADIQTIITWFEDYIRTGEHVEDLDTLLRASLRSVFIVSLPSSADVGYLGAWVREVNAADGYIVVRVAEQDITVSIEAVTQHLPWWLLAKDVTFQIGLCPDDATTMQEGQAVPAERWSVLVYDVEQLLDDDEFLAESFTTDN